MPIYTCNQCHFSTHIKTHYMNHLQTKKHLKYKKSHPKVTQKSPFSHQKVTIFDKEDASPFQCHYCLKRFKYKQGMYRHIKYTCKKNEDEDLKELARLLNEQLEEKNQQIETIQSSMQKQIDKLTTKLQIQSVNQNINNGTINNTVNIKLLSHMDTDYSHLTPNDYMKCFGDCRTCVKTLIEKVHFNKDKPENMNIYISNIKGNYIMIYTENGWQIEKRKKQIDDLYEYNEMVLETWYDDYKENYPHIIESFQRYLKNRDDDHLLNKVKEDILLMLYNKRGLIENE